MEILSAAIVPRTAGLGRPIRLVALVAALVLAVLAEALARPALYGIIAAAFAGGLMATREQWITRRTGRIALFLTAASIVGTFVAGGAPARVASTAARMSDVIILILCVALIRPALVALKLDHAIAAVAARAPRNLRGGAVLLGVAVFGLGLSFGAVSVFGGSLRGRTSDDSVAARAAMRGLSLSMLLGPSTASVAAVMAAYPAVGWSTALLIGLPIALAGVILGAVGARDLTISAPPASRAEVTHAILAILAVPAGAGFLHFAMGFSITLGISVSAVAVAMFLLIWAARGGTGWYPAFLRFDEQIGEAWTQASAEIALFLACGLVLGAMREPVLAETARTLIASVLPTGLPALLFLMVVVPLVTPSGLHPMALFAVLGPVLTPSLLGLSQASVFQAWIVAIGLAMVVSPASILTVTTVSGFGVPAKYLCLRGNGLYALGFAAIATSMLFLRS